MLFPRFLETLTAAVVLTATAAAAQDAAGPSPLPSATTASAPFIVADPTLGIVDAAALAAYRRFDALDGGRQATLSDQKLAEELVVLRVLEARFLAANRDRDPSYDRHVRTIEQTAAKQLVTKAIRTESAPSDEALRAIFDADPAAFLRPARWRLEHIYQRFPDDASEDDKAEIIAMLRDLRAQLDQGASFADLAREHSQSVSRQRGGTIGFVELPSLAPEIAAVVAPLKEGDISPVAITADGASIVRCTQRVEAEQPSFDEVRHGLGNRIAHERRTAATDSLLERLRRDLAPVLRPEMVRSQAEAETVVASFQRGDARRTISLAAFAAWTQHERRPPPWTLPEARLEALLEEHVLLEGWWDEAERRGITEDDPFRVLVDGRVQRLRAQRQANVDSTAWIVAPSEDDVTKLYEQRKERLRNESRYTFDLLVVPIDRSLDRAYYEQVREAAEQGTEQGAEQGALDLASLAADLGPPARFEQFERHEATRLWRLAPPLLEQLDAVAVGQLTPLVQEGPTLYLARLLGREPGRLLRFEEAKPRLVSLLEAGARRHAGLKLRQEILTKVDVRRVP